VNFSILGIVILIAGSLGGWIGHKATSMHYELLIAEEHAAQAELQDFARIRDNTATARYATAKDAIRARTTQATTEVINALQDDSCARAPLPQRVRDAIATAQAGTAEPVPDDAMRLVPAEGTADLGRPGSFLRGITGSFGRLSGKASSLVRSGHLD
jgi:hypothetical protein